ncbi:CBASS cGAMP synthase [uncultured Algoriphagus sp.]|uniref:CBASS cGAMP synthase n=1 Tax=uncultured Algoriphagus sp. TaxID=417365 RepID=UPI0030EF5A42|tara:strand:- start:33370 stop:34413 length:1044 start_codon:yes stop_codon:yes gene_type:complete
MANCNLLLSEYNNIIRLSDERRQQLLEVRNNLRIRLRRGYSIVSEELGLKNEIIHQSQGSFVMDTIISPIRGDYDIDDGLYFIGNLDRKNRPSPSDLHKLVKYALDRGHDDIERVIDKSTCIRVQYKSGFHVDIPIYYADNVDCPELADVNRGWILSHPIEFIEWFEQKVQSGFRKAFITESRLFDEFVQWTSDIRKNDHQLRRIVRFLKAWGDLRREEMPCGLIMTILAANNYYPHQRDDISIKETLINIQAALRNDFRCERPTTPKGENLFEDYKNKDAFMKYLGYFIDNAKKALEEPNQKLACKHWQASLGDRFPCNSAKDENIGNAATVSLGIGGSIRKPWCY